MSTKQYAGGEEKREDAKPTTHAQWKAAQLNAIFNAARNGKPPQSNIRPETVAHGERVEVVSQ